MDKEQLIELLQNDEVVISSPPILEIQPPSSTADIRNPSIKMHKNHTKMIVELDIMDLAGVTMNVTGGFVRLS